MIQILYGERGSGKTDRMLELANQAGASARGDVVFLSKDNRNMYNVNHTVRYIDVSAYEANKPQVFIGLICGLLAGNFDIEKVFLLSLPSLGGFGCADNMEVFIGQLEHISSAHNVDFIMSVRGELSAAPQFFLPYIV